MVKRSTWVLLFILMLSIGAYFLIEKHPYKIDKPTPTVTVTSYLVNQDFGKLISLHIFDNKGTDIKLQKDMSNTWIITAPASSAADQGLASAAETQVGALNIVAFLESPPSPATIGLVSPAYTMELGFSNASHKIEVGNLTPTSSGYYVRFDGENIYIISRSGIDALVKLVSSPPYAATETPPPSPDATLNP
jgi:hypothetical protein